MAIEAPISRHKKTNFKIYILICLGLAVWFAYDGYLSEDFKSKHAPEGKPDSTYVFNRHAPFYLGGAAVVLAAYFWSIKDKKLVADENELRLSDDEAVKYDAIEAIDKTHFAKRGYFVITYKSGQDKIVTRELNDRNWDNLAAVLDHLVSKMSA
jgi:hypothetical protein